MGESGEVAPDFVGCVTTVNDWLWPFPPESERAWRPPALVGPIRGDDGGVC